MQKNTDFESFHEMMGQYINAVYIGTVERIKKRKSSYNPLDEILRDATKQSIYYNYVETSLNMNADTFKEAIENKNYAKNEYWLNSIYDFYKNTLLSNKRRNTSLEKQV